MRRLRNAVLAALLVLFIAGSARAQTPALIWAKSFGGTGLQSAYAMALRGTTLWVSGTTSGTLDLGGANYAPPLNAYLAGFSTDGTYQWSHAFNVGGGVITSLGVDTANNVYITGQFDGTVDFGGGPLTSLGGYDMFLAKFNSAGLHQWSKRFGDAGLNDAGLALAIDFANNVVVGGRFSGTTDFGGGPLTTAGQTDAFIAKFNSAGTHQWSKKFGDASSQEVNGLASVNGDVYITGTYSGAINLGGSAFTSVGSSDIFLAKFNSAGTHQWSKSFGDATGQYAYDVDADAFGVYLLAGVQGNVNFGGGLLTSDGSTDIAVAKYTLAGAHTWSRIFGDSNAQVGTAIDAAGGSVFVAGYFEGSLDFGHPLNTGNTHYDAFIARLSPSDGSEIWSQHFGEYGNDDYGSDLVSDGTHTFLGGHFQKDIDFGYNGALFSPTRDYDAFVAEFGSVTQEPDIISVTDVKHDQGGKVTLRFARTDYDGLASVVPIRGYEIYLRDDPLNLAAGRSARPKAPAADTWILAGEAPAHGLSEYYTLAFTQEDSTIATGLHTSVYKVRAVTDNPSVYFDSLVLGGYSLDNLAPAVPLNFVINDGELSWRASGDDDIAYYSVYGSAGAFDETAVLIDYTTTTRQDVTLRAFAHYYVTATDRAGNEGRPAALEGSRAATSLPPRTLSVSAYPNPFNPATTIRYTLPEAGRVRVEVYDARGAHVSTLFDGERAAGAAHTSW
jgi:hypothetical protein